MTTTLIGLESLWIAQLTLNEGDLWQNVGTYPDPPFSYNTRTDTPDFFHVPIAHIVPNNDVTLLRDSSATWGLMNLGTCEAQYQPANCFTSWLGNGPPTDINALALNSPNVFSTFGSLVAKTLGFGGNPVTSPRGDTFWQWTGNLYVVCIPISLDTWVPILRNGPLIQSIFKSTNFDFAGVAGDLGYWAGTGPNWQYSVGVDLDA